MTPRLAPLLFGLLPACAPPGPARSPDPAGAAWSAPIALDAHVHVFKSGLPLAKVRPFLAKAHVERAALVSAGYPMHDRAAAAAENDFVAGEIKGAPGFLGYCGVHPLEPWALDELRRCKADLGLHGVKIHVGEQGLDLANADHLAAVDRIMGLAAAQKMIVLAHLDRTWRPFVKLAEKHPAATVVIAHALLHEYRDLSYLAMRFEMAKKLGGKAPANLYFDVSGLVTYYESSPYREAVAWHLRKLGKDRLLFASDYPVYTPEETLAALLRCGFSEDELRAMLVDNPRRVYALR